jgi:hypothetical protein
MCIRTYIIFTILRGINIHMYELFNLKKNLKQKLKSSNKFILTFYFLLNGIQSKDLFFLFVLDLKYLILFTKTYLI